MLQPQKESVSLSPELCHCLRVHPVSHTTKGQCCGRSSTVPNLQPPTVNSFYLRVFSKKPSTCLLKPAQV